MKKISTLFLGAVYWINILPALCTEKFEILPDLPEPLAAQASSISTVSEPAANTVVQSVGQEPNIISVVLSLLFVILLIYATGIIYAKLNKAGLSAMKHQLGDAEKNRVSVISTTPLGSNKTLHVVELDGKRMLIGASANSIDLLKDLGSYPPVETENIEYSKIEIPNIRIPKIEIPKIEFPNIGFTKTAKKEKKENTNVTDSIENTKQDIADQNNDDFVISDIFEDNSDGIIDKLFTPQSEDNDTSVTK